MDEITQWSLSADAFNQGRRLLSEKDLDGFMRWLEREQVAIDRTVVRDTYAALFRAGDLEKILLMFDRVFPGIDCAYVSEHGNN